MRKKNRPLASERQDRILEILRIDKTVKVAELSNTFGVSEMTIRRDLIELEQAGLLKRTFGGAVASPNFLTLQLSFVEKQSICSEEKKAIGLAASSFIREGETIAFGGGTTTFQVAIHVGKVEQITVVTNSINLAAELANRSDIQLVVTGGTLRERSFALVGTFGEAMLSQIHINKLFLGAAGISLEHGVTIPGLLEASMYKAMVKAAEELFIVADHTKFGRVTLVPIVWPREATKIITDTGISEEHIEKFREDGIELVLADPRARCSSASDMSSI